MTTIRTTCNRCGDVELTTSDIGLELTAERSTGSYRFECPFCSSIQRRPANHRVVSILLATGVTFEFVTPDTETITEDEIEEFVRSLDDDGWFSEITAS